MTDLQRVRRRIVDHLAGGGSPEGTVSISAPTEEERRAVARLLGTRVSRALTLRLSLASLATTLSHAGLGEDVAAALQVLEGPIPDRAGQRQRAIKRWEAVTTQALEWDERRPRFGHWAQGVAASGRLRRASEGDAEQAMVLLRQVAAVLDSLPLTEASRRQRLASDTLGQAHGLDRGTTLAGLVLDAVAADVGGSTLPGAEGEMDLWAQMGVLADDLTSRVCVLNLPVVGDGPVDRLLGATPGEPVWVTLRMLLRHPLTPRPGLIYACENLSIIAEAAERLGPDCAPLVCVAGNPVVAVMRLLDQLVAHQCEVAYHGDFDWAGVQIAGRVLHRLGPTSGRPWRLGAGDYEAAVRGSTVALPALRQRYVETPWDPALADVMRTGGVAVEEEVVAKVLLADLAS